MGIYYNDYFEHSQEMNYDEFCLDVLHRSPDMTLADFHALEEKNGAYFFKDLDEFMFFIKNREQMMYRSIIADIKREHAGFTQPIPF